MHAFLWDISIHHMYRKYSMCHSHIGSNTQTLLHGCIVSSQRWKDVWGGKFGMESWNGGGDDSFRRNSTLWGTLLVSSNEAMKPPKILVKSLITSLSRVGTRVALVMTFKYTSLILGSCFFHIRHVWLLGMFKKTLISIWSWHWVQD